MILDDYVEIIRDAIYGDAITTGGWIELGTGTTAVQGSDTALETAITRKTCVNSKVGTDIASFTTTWSTAEGNGNAFTEVGCVNAAAAGVFLNRKVFPAFNKTSSFELRMSVYIKSANN